MSVVQSKTHTPIVSELNGATLNALADYILDWRPKCDIPEVFVTVKAPYSVSIGHLINKEMLKKCHETMQKDKATGIDGITKEEYGKHLEENLEKLVERLKNRSYKPKPARRVEIPKPNGKTRPLSIYCYEDKLERV